MLHPALPTDLYLTKPRDLLDRAYYLEMRAALRLEDHGEMPGSTRCDISKRPEQRTFYDDCARAAHHLRLQQHPHPPSLFSSTAPAHTPPLPAPPSLTL